MISFITFHEVIGIVTFTILCFIALLIILSPTIGAFLLYKKLRGKGKHYKWIGLVIFSLTALITLAIALKIMSERSGFGPEYETAEIKQKIGGTLLCKSVYNADVHSWQYDVKYQYITESGDSLDLESGSYYGREWGKDEQINRLGDWLILTTGNRNGSDRLILKNIQTDSTIINDITDQSIESDSLWKAQGIESLFEICCSETFIEKISGSEILVIYKFRTDENTKEYGERKIIYKIDPKIGQIKINRIEKNNR